VLLLKLKIIGEKRNPYLNRNELNIEITHEAMPTPSKASVQLFLSKELGREIERIDIRGIYSNYGTGVSKANVFVWDEKKISDLSKVVDKKDKVVDKKEEQQDKKEKK